MLKTAQDKINEAIKVLEKYNILINLNNVTMYHGRATNSLFDDFKINANFNNSSNNTGNNNVYNVSTLYTSPSYQIAKEFAEERTTSVNQYAEVHKIFPLKKNSYVVSWNTNRQNYTEDQQLEILDALKTITHPIPVYSDFTYITLDSPIPFKYKTIMPEILDSIQDVHKSGYITDEEIAKINANIFLKYNFSENIMNDIYKLTEYYCSSYNTKLLLSRNPSFAINYYKNGQSVHIFKNEKIKINLNYLKNFYNRLNIVGIFDHIRSATINKTIDSFCLFDLASVGSKSQRTSLIEKNKNMQTAFKVLELDKIKMNDEIFNFLKTSSGKESILMLHSNQNLKTLYKKSCHIYENWNIGQHTAGVIDCYNKYYKDEFPEAMAPFMKLLFCAHDIGKWQAKENGTPQKEANIKHSDTLFDVFEIEEKYRNLLKFLIGDCQDFTTNYHLNYYSNKEKLVSEIYLKCHKILSDDFDSYNELTTEAQKFIVQNVIKVGDCLQHCDSLSYTKLGKVAENKYYVSGVNQQFLNSFKFDPTDRNIPKLSNELNLL